MKFMELIFLCRDVLLDWRVIGITIAMIVYVGIIRYVIRYKKKPPKLRKQISVTSAPAPAPQEDSSDSGSGDDADGGEE